jgi:hypothetical protein
MAQNFSFFARLFVRLCGPGKKWMSNQSSSLPRGILLLMFAILLVASCTQSQAGPVTITSSASVTGSPSPVLQTRAVATTTIGVSKGMIQAGASPLPSPTITTLPANKLGIHLLLDDGRNQWPVETWPEHMAYARQVVGEWGYVTELVRQDDLDPARWQIFMDLCAELQLTPILRLATTFDREAGWWRAPQSDAEGRYHAVAAQYATFVKSLDWPAPYHYVIVGNEPNHGNEWSGRPDPVAYARFLLDVGAALRQVDPTVRVLNAGFDPYTPHTNGQPFLDGMAYMDAETFLDEMFAAEPEVFKTIDIWSSHAYPMGPLTQGPWLQSFGIDLLNGAVNPRHIPPPTGIYNRGINGYEWELFKLSTFGVYDLPIMITETGWRHAETTDPAATDNGRPLPDSETVARYFVLALWGNDGRYPELPESGWTPWLDDPRIIGVTPFALNGLPAEWGHTNWLALDPQGRVLGAYAPFTVLAVHNAPP